MVDADKPLVMQPPISASFTASTPASTPPKLEPVTLAIKPDAVFSTAVGPPNKKTLAVWHESSPRDIVAAMLELVGVKNSDGLPDKDAEHADAAAAAAAQQQQPAHS